MARRATAISAPPLRGQGLPMPAARGRLLLISPAAAAQASVQAAGSPMAATVAACSGDRVGEHFVRWRRAVRRVTGRRAFRQVAEGRPTGRKAFRQMAKRRPTGRRAFRQVAEGRPTGRRTFRQVAERCRTGRRAFRQMAKRRPTGRRAFRHVAESCRTGRRAFRQVAPRSSDRSESISPDGETPSDWPENIPPGGPSLVGPVGEHFARWPLARPTGRRAFRQVAESRPTGRRAFRQDGTRSCSPRIPHA